MMQKPSSFLTSLILTLAALERHPLEEVRKLGYEPIWTTRNLSKTD